MWKLFAYSRRNNDRFLRKERKDAMKLTEGTIWKKMIVFYIPLLMSSLLQQLYNAADAVVVGKYIGKEALSAVGGTTSILFGLIIGLFTGIASGSTVVVGKHFGADKEKKVADTVKTSLCISVIGGIGIGVIGYVLTPQLLGLMNTPTDILPDATTYMRIIFSGTLCSLVYNMGISILRALGDSRIPMVLGIVGSTVNISMNLIFVLVFKRGVDGVAYATVLSQLVSCVLVLVVLRRNRNIKIDHWLKPSINKNHLVEVLRAGLPTGVHTIMYGISNGIIQANINLFGTDVVAAWTAYSKIAMFFWTVMSAMGITVTAFVSQNKGAQKFDRIKSGVNQALWISVGITLFMTFVFQVFSKPLIGIFTKDAAVLDLGMEQIKFMSACYILYTAGEIYIGALRGAGRSFSAMISSLITVCALSVVWVEIIAKPYNNVIMTLCGFPLTWILSSIVLMLYWKILEKRAAI